MDYEKQAVLEKILETLAGREILINIRIVHNGQPKIMTKVAIADLRYKTLCGGLKGNFEMKVIDMVILRNMDGLVEIPFREITGIQLLFV